NMLRGKYHRPREEERIFMFIDLKSSTTIAEELGNIRYSKFIQDCFIDLNEIFPKYDARVYQYVGDEAVLTWHPQRGLTEHKCIACFEAFSERLAEKRDYYIKTYGHAPEFKAGAHAGPIVITEVGIVKKELAYHGDVINTTARIQSMCNTFDQKLLISQELLDKLPGKDKLSYAFQSKLQLRGKNQETAIYSVT
ncbi:MAG: adenylate/guanylate cyclase domain-containing protein, partial [Bacteroidota bacterium]